MTAPRILYVDDDDGLRRLIERALARRGFAVTTAASADDGLALLQAEQFDLAAIDDHMPGKSGRQMLDEIVALPDHPPVVFVTGNDDTRVAVEALHAGAMDFVVKTVGDGLYDTLDSRFRQVLSRAALERDKRHAEAALRVANDRLEVMLREVHHRVANSLQMVLSFVAMQGNQSDDATVKDALADVQQRIRAISKVHQRLYTREDISAIDLDAYLANLVDDLRGAASDQARAITIELEAEPVEVSPDAGVSVGVIVTELVSNAIKYAFPDNAAGRVTVALHRADGGYTVRVADDGKGSAEGDAPTGTGFGTRIIAAMARGLGTEVRRVPCERGTCMEMTVAHTGPHAADAVPA